jgi:hypothetical protein
MSSSLRALAVKTSNTINTGGYSCPLFQVADIESAFLLSSANPLGAKVTKSMYIANTQAAFNTILATLNTVSGGLTAADYTLEDMGTKIQIGVQGGANNILVLTRVKLTFVDATTYAEPTGYVVVENRTSNSGATYAGNWRGA